MINLKQRNIDIINTILLVSLFLNNYLNLLFFFGIENDLRRIFVIFSSLFYSIFCLAIFINFSRLDVVFLRRVKKFVLIFLLLMVIYVPFLSFNLNDYISFFIYSLPILTFFLLNLYNSQFNIDSINYIPIILFIVPVTFFYFFRFFLSSNDISILDIGNVSYLVIGYFYLLLFVTIYTLINIETCEFRYKNRNIYSFIFLIVLCFNIINSGAKGPLISMFIFIFYDFFYNLFLMRKFKPSLVIIFSASLLLSFSFSISNSGLYRFKSFIGETSSLLNNSFQIDSSIPEVIEGDDTESQKDDANSDVIDDELATEVSNSIFKSISNLVSLNEDEKRIVLVLVESGGFYETIKNIELNEPELRDAITEIRRSSTSARKILYYTSIKEISMHPISGMGLFGFQMKYGTYPHNLLLEILSDFGLVLGLPILIIIAMFFVYFALARNLSNFEMLIRNLISATMPFLMVSGTFYFNQIFFMFILLILYKAPKLIYFLE